MKRNIIDLDLLDQNDEVNPFENLMAKLEKINLENKNIINLDTIEKTVLYLERKCQDFSDNETGKARIIYQALSAVNIIFDEDSSNDFNKLQSNLYALQSLARIIEDEKKLDEDSITLKNIIKIASPRKQKISVDVLQEAFSKLSNSLSSEIIKENKEQWLIEFNFDVEKDELHKPLEFIHLFIEACNKIEGVSLKLEDIKIGSLKAKISALFDNLKAKQEFKDVLEGSKKIVKGKVEKEFNESEKAGAEKIKTDVEIKILEEQLSDLISDDSKEVKELQKESLKIDIERKKIENERLRLELFREKRELLKELLAEGIINQQNFEMMIKGLPFIKYENGQLTIGESINVIDDL